MNISSDLLLDFKCIRMRLTVCSPVRDSVFQLFFICSENFYKSAENLQNPICNFLNANMQRSLSYLPVSLSWYIAQSSWIAFLLFYSRRPNGSFLTVIVYWTELNVQWTLKPLNACDGRTRNYLYIFARCIPSKCSVFWEVSLFLSLLKITCFRFFFASATDQKIQFVSISATRPMRFWFVCKLWHNGSHSNVCILIIDRLIWQSTVR